MIQLVEFYRWSYEREHGEAQRPPNSPTCKEKRSQVTDERRYESAHHFARYFGVLQQLNWVHQAPFYSWKMRYLNRRNEEAYTQYQSYQGEALEKARSFYDFFVGLFLLLVVIC